MRLLPYPRENLGVLTDLAHDLCRPKLSFRTLARIRGGLTDAVDEVSGKKRRFPYPLEDLGGANLLSELDTIL